MHRMDVQRASRLWSLSRLFAPLSPPLGWSTDDSSPSAPQRIQVMCMSVAIGHVKMSKEEIALNIQLAANFLASLLKKNWQNIKVSLLLLPLASSVKSACCALPPLAPAHPPPRDSIDRSAAA